MKDQSIEEDFLQGIPCSGKNCQNKAHITLNIMTTRGVVQVASCEEHYSRVIKTLTWLEDNALKKAMESIEEE